MAKKEYPLNSLASYLPENSLEGVMYYLNTHEVHLTITRERKTVLGDYRNKRLDKNHRITVNGNLNKYSFLITLLHEIAHLLAFEKYGHSIAPHGKEWKKVFADVLKDFISNEVFPKEVTMVLLKSINNLAASSCADLDLLRVLKSYDTKVELLIEDLEEGEHFIIKGGRVFERGPQIRKRYKCKELATGKMYLFSPVYAVARLKR